MNSGEGAMRERAESMPCTPLVNEEMFMDPLCSGLGLTIERKTWKLYQLRLMSVGDRSSKSWEFTGSST